MTTLSGFSRPSHCRVPRQGDQREVAPADVAEAVAAAEHQPVGMRCATSVCSWCVCRRHKAHLFRDFADAAEVYPDKHWPVQARRVLCGLIRAWHTARQDSLAEIVEDVRKSLVSEFRHAIRVGLAQVPQVAGPRHRTAQHPGRDLLEFCRDREDDVRRFCFDTRIGPRTTSANATSDPPRPSKDLQHGATQRKSPTPAPRGVRRSSAESPSIRRTRG